MDKPSASILMSVYDKVETVALSQCLDSLAAQTRIPQQIVIIKDGQLTESLDRLLDAFARNLGDIVLLIPVEENAGLVNALNLGLRHCSGDWILRMDADDVAQPNRVEVQMDYVSSHPDIDVLGTSMMEFTDSPDKPLRLKPVVTSHDEIRAQLPYRNPVNHPTVCFRKVMIESVGGYPALKYLEDYFLWAVLFEKGARFHNLDQPLHLYRFDSGTLNRRGGTLNFMNESKLRWWMYQHGLMGPVTLVMVIAAQLILRFSPGYLKQYIWQLSRKDLPYQTERNVT